MFQLIPYKRIQTHFDNFFDIPISTGSLVNFNADAYQRVDVFETYKITEDGEHGLFL
ncbi:MAG: transposase [Lentisphaeria bacterium]|jgi:transposase